MMQFNKQRKPMKLLYVWLIFFVTLILGGLIIWWANSVNSTTIPIIFLVVDFLIMSVALQICISRTFKYKPKPRKFTTKEYSLESFDQLSTTLKKQGFKESHNDFGLGYIKIIDKVAYKVVLIKDYEKYFNQDPNKKTGNPTPGIEKCTKFIGFEFFNSNEDVIVDKVVDFTFQGENVYYAGFYYDEAEKKLIEANYLEPNEHHLQNYNYLKTILALNNIEE